MRPRSVKVQSYHGRTNRASGAHYIPQRVASGQLSVRLEKTLENIWNLIRLLACTGNTVGCSILDRGGLVSDHERF
jgi:hypothetical protein